MKAINLLANTITVLGLPVWGYQGVKLKRSALRLPEATGDRSFLSGSQSCNEGCYNLLVLGDSVAAGVGCTTIDKSLAGALAESLSIQLNKQVQTSVIAKSGDKIENTIEAIEGQQFDADLIVISLGVNDAKGFTSTDKWSQQLKSLLSTINNQAANAQIIVIPTPPLEQFPLIKWPLSSVLGNRAKRLNYASFLLLAPLDNVYFYNEPFDTTPEHFAEDGFHPNYDACKIIASKILENLFKIKAIR